MKTIAFIGCSASKAGTIGRAADLYTGELFKLQKRWVSSVPGLEWWILSAKYGLIAPGMNIAPYEETINTVAERRAWDAKVLEQLRTGTSHTGSHLHLPTRTLTRVLVFAGENYRQWTRDALEFLEFPWRYEVPLQGLGIGEQRAALGRMVESLECDKHAGRLILPEDRIERSLATITGGAS